MLLNTLAERDWAGDSRPRWLRKPCTMVRDSRPVTWLRPHYRGSGGVIGTTSVGNPDASNQVERVREVGDAKTPGHPW